MSILGALGSALSMGMLDMYNTFQTNESNERINNYTLRQQKELYNDQKEENRFLVDQAYERNLPKNVKKNLLEAGINPAFAMESGSFGSASAQVGNAPSAPNLPQAHPSIKSDAAAIMGQGISDAFNRYLAEKQEIRADKALNHQIAMDRAENDMKYLDLIDRIHGHGWSNAQTQANTAKILDDLNFAKKTESERARGIALANANLEADKDFRDRELKVKEAALQNDIRLSSSQISQIAQAINESKQRVDNMLAEQDLSYKQYQQELKKSLFEMKAELLRIGISEEQLKSQKFKDFFGTIVNSLITGAGVYYGLRGARAVGSAVKSKSYKGAPFKMEPYDPVKDTPWNFW